MIQDGKTPGAGGGLQRTIDHILNFGSSIRITVVLLLGLAATAVFGTIWPSRDSGLDVYRFELFYQSPWFRLLLLLLALNLTICTVRLVRRRLRQLRQWLTEPPVGGSCCEHECATIEADGRRLGFRSRSTSYGLLLWRGSLGRWGVVGIHLSLLLIMAGGVAGSLGFVATLNIYSGDSSTQFFDWDEQRDRPIGFVFRLDHFEPRYYPIELKFAVIDPQTGRQVEEIIGAEGDEVTIPSLGLTARINSYIFAR